MRDAVDLTLQKLRHWRLEGRDLPAYEMDEGLQYICRLLDIPWNRQLFGIIEKIEREHPTVFISIAGPHGWAYLKILIMKMQERELPRKVRKAKQKVWRRNRKLEESNEINTGVQKP